MLTKVGQYVGAKVVGGAVTLGVIGGGIWFWNHPEQLVAIWQAVKYALVWVGLAAALPWATFFVTRWALSFDSNRAEALLLAGYAAADFLFAWLLLGTLRGLGSLTWMVLILGLLAASFYNYRVCDFIAEGAEGQR